MSFNPCSICAESLAQAKHSVRRAYQAKITAWNRLFYAPVTTAHRNQYEMAASEFDYMVGELIDTFRLAKNRKH